MLARSSPLVRRGGAKSGCWTSTRRARCWTTISTPTPGKYGGGGAGTTWLVGSPQDVANSLLKYQALGVSHFVLSDTPYLEEIKRQGDQLLPLLRRRPVGADVRARALR